MFIDSIRVPCWADEVVSCPNGEKTVADDCPAMEADQPQLFLPALAATRDVAVPEECGWETFVVVEGEAVTAVEFA